MECKAYIICLQFVLSVVQEKGQMILVTGIKIYTVKNPENAGCGNCVSIVKRDAGEKIIVRCLYMEQWHRD
jgi:hypothetical protein